MITLGVIADAIYYNCYRYGTEQTPKGTYTARLCRVASSLTYEWLDSYFPLVVGSVAKHHRGETRIFLFSSLC